MGEKKGREPKRQFGVRSVRDSMSRSEYAIYSIRNLGPQRSEHTCNIMQVILERFKKVKEDSFVKQELGT